MTDQTPVLEADSITVEVGDRKLLSEVSACVYPGEILAVIGPNGAGKSTLLQVLSGDLRPDSGQVLLGGQPIDSIKADKLALGRAVLPQQSLLRFAFTVEDVVMMGRHPHRRQSSAAQDRDIAERAMRQTEVRVLAERTYPTLSGGEQARTMLARILAQEAGCLLLDEPTAALDIRHQELVLEIARELASQGVAILAILHDLNLAAAYADRVLILKNGRVDSCGPPWEALTPARLSDVFDHPIAVTPHPVRDCPMIVPLPRGSSHVLNTCVHCGAVHFASLRACR